MKIILFSFVLFTVASFKVKAQSCKSPCPYYKDFVSMAAADTVKNTQTKLNYYRAAIVAAKDCNCPTLEQAANKEIDQLFVKIEAEKKRAEVQAQTILEQQDEIKIALKDAKAANEKNIKIINAMDFYDGKFALALKDGKYGFIDKDGNSRLGFEYNKGGPFNPSTGFAEMENSSSYQRTRYLLDTSSNRYRLVNISEILREEGIVQSILSKEEITLLKNELSESEDQSKKKVLAKLEKMESKLESTNEKLVKNLNKDKEKLALDFSDLAKNDVLSILQHLLGERKIKNRVELLLFSGYGNDIDTFPAFITEFTNLKKIDIARTEIRSIPESIDRLTALKTLNLPTSVKRVPSSLYNLENLESLSLFYTEYQALPEAIGNLKKLKSLHLPRQLREIPSSLYELENLEILHAGYTWIKEVPEAIGKLKNLKKLSLPHHLRKIPLSVYSLENLKTLFLCSTDEVDIPESIGNLKKLEYLNIQMPMKKLPASVCLLENLRDIRLYDTQLIALPESIEKLKKLEKLYLPETIETLPEGIGNLENLKVFSPSGLTVEVLPKNLGNLKKLETLDLSETGLKVLPESVGQLINLEDLRLPPSLEELSEGLGNLKYIKKLDLSETKVKALPNDIDQLINLEDLRLPPSLETFSESLGNLTSLKRLEMKENQNIKTFPNISKMKKLESFDFTLYKDEHYDANLKIWEELEKELPDCSFQVVDEKGEFILDLLFLDIDFDLDLD